MLVGTAGEVDGLEPRPAALRVLEHGVAEEPTFPHVEHPSMANADTDVTSSLMRVDHDGQCQPVGCRTIEGRTLPGSAAPFPLVTGRR
jgi:hypothetical protein